jgi:NAD-dependent dihydropyrimidine dehydrogenase PreA subunit/ferredoxin
MAKVTVLPANIEFEAKPGETMMGAAQARGLYWPTTCGGQGMCTTCLAEVVTGAGHLLEMSRGERKTIVAERGEGVLRQPVRLACQAVVLDGPIVVEKAGCAERKRQYDLRNHRTPHRRQDLSCIDVCPVDCIYGKDEDEQLYIDAEKCIDCAACEAVCPVTAIFFEDDVPPQWTGYIEKQSKYFENLSDEERSTPSGRAVRGSEQEAGSSQSIPLPGIVSPRYLCHPQFLLSLSKPSIEGFCNWTSVNSKRSFRSPTRRALAGRRKPCS